MKKKEIINLLKTDLDLYNTMILNDAKFIKDCNGRVSQEFEEISFGRQCISTYLTRLLEIIED